VPEPLHDRLHVGHGVRRGAETEAAMAPGHDGRVVIAAMIRYVAKYANAAIIITCTSG